MSLKNRAEGDTGSVLECYVSELSNTVIAAGNAGDKATSALEKLRIAFPAIEAFHTTSHAGEDGPLHLVAAAADNLGIQALSDAGADANSVGESGDTPLFRAAKAFGPGSGETTVLLLERRADPNVQNNRGNTPLHMAAYYGRIHAVKALLAAEASTSIVNRGGETPLHRAARGGEIEILRALASNGADFCVQDGQGMTAITAAKERGKTAAVAELLLLTSGVACGDDQEL